MNKKYLEHMVRFFNEFDPSDLESRALTRAERTIYRVNVNDNGFEIFPKPAKCPYGIYVSTESPNINPQAVQLLVSKGLLRFEPMTKEEQSKEEWDETVINPKKLKLVGFQEQNWKVRVLAFLDSQVKSADSNLIQTDSRFGGDHPCPA